MKPPRGIPVALLAVAPAVVKNLTRSHRVSHHRFTAATGWTPAHPSVHDSWPRGAER